MTRVIVCISAALSRIVPAAIVIWIVAPASAMVGGAAPLPDASVRPEVMIVGSRGNSCTGTLIAPDLVLTAAHCVQPDADYKLVQLDANRQPSLRDTARIERHPQFSMQTFLGHRATADVALIKLAAPMPIAQLAVVANEKLSVAPGDRFVVVGFGLTKDGDGKTGGVLRAAPLIVTGKPGNLQIRLYDPATRGERSGLGACTGDSGAPVYQDSGGRLAVIGVVSWSTGPGGDAGCGGLTGVTPLDLYRDWIIHTANKLGSSLLPKQSAEHQTRFLEYTVARENFEREVSAYWNSIDEKRRSRIEKRRNNQEILIDDYILSQPPVYSGPIKPQDPTTLPEIGIAVAKKPDPSRPIKPWDRTVMPETKIALAEKPIYSGPIKPRDLTAIPEAEIAPAKKYLPVVADFLKFAAEQFQFVPERPTTELEFKRAYATMAASAGLTKDQVVRIYGFETGGNGKYDMQAGLQYSKPGAQAISTALGYNQLLAANTVGLLAEKGDQFVSELRKKADEITGERKNALNAKIEILQRMIAVTRAVLNKWSEHVILGDTAPGLGIHALNLDIDVGPLLQTQKLLDSIIFARARRYKAPLSAAELEMMNLTGDGNGFEMVMMPLALRNQVPTSNFFQQGGYERNSVASRNNVVAKLLAATEAKMDTEVLLNGAKELASAFQR